MPRVERLGCTPGWATGLNDAGCTCACGTRRCATGNDCCIATAGTTVVARLFTNRLMVVLLTFVVLLTILVRLMLIAPALTRRP
jgi:hypothetical protein